MNQREFFSRGKELKIARATWTNSILEKTIVKVIRDGLVACRIPHWLVLARIPCPQCGRWAAEPPDPGISDIAGIIPANLFVEGFDGAPWGCPLFIEVKRPKGGVEEFEQKLFLEERRKQGAIAFFARGWDQTAALLRASGVRLPSCL